MPSGATVLTAAALLALAVLAWPTGGGGRPSSSARPGRGRSGSSAVALAFGRLRRAHRPHRAAWVADFAEVVAIGLRAGLDLPSAALVSASSPGVVAAAPWLAPHLRHSIRRGQGVATVLDLEDGRHRDGDLDLGDDADGGHDIDLAPDTAIPDREARADEPGAEALDGDGGVFSGSRGSPPLGALERRDLAHLVAAWRLAEGVGAAAADVTASAASSVRERQAAHERTAVVMAGPRASMLLLSALPLAGPVAALVLGIPPGRLYGSAASRLLAAAGLGLTALGWWWARRLLSHARRPGRTDAGTS